LLRDESCRCLYYFVRRFIQSCELVPMNLERLMVNPISQQRPAPAGSLDKKLEGFGTRERVAAVKFVFVCPLDPKWSQGRRSCHVGMPHFGSDFIVNSRKVFDRSFH
jgi:hypothetical protein